MILNYLGQNSILDLQVGHKCSLILCGIREKKNLLTRLISRGNNVTTVLMVVMAELL